MVERRPLTKELDAIIGVREEKAGYRDSWRIRLAAAAGQELWKLCSLLKLRELSGG
jgi:hypothetical protein